MGVTIRLESALADLAKKMERANERHCREPRDEIILKAKEVPKAFKVGFVSILYFIKFAGENFIN